MYFDSHCHLTDERLADDLPAVLARARNAGVEGMVCIASDAADAEEVAGLAAGEDAVWGTAGIHPHVAAEAGPDDLERVADLARRRPEVVAIGEIGLDYHYDNSPRDVQRRLFVRQMELALELDLPVVVHSRDADDDTIALLRDIGSQVRGVLHCFTGGDTLLDEGLEAGWHVSYSGIVSFSSFRSEAGVRRVPKSRLLIETDAPYLAPEPHRGRRNEPAFVEHVAEAVARIRGEDPEDVGRFTAINAREFYGLDTAEDVPAAGPQSGPRE